MKQQPHRDDVYLLAAFPPSAPERNVSPISNNYSLVTGLRLSANPFLAMIREKTKSPSTRTTALLILQQQKRPQKRLNLLTG